jgi:hypothetical protein
MRNRSVARWVLIGMLMTLWGCSHSGSNTSSSSNNTGATSGGNATSASTPPQAPAPPPPVEIPAGTTLTITLDQNIGTATNNSGDSFEASLAEPVTVDGNTVLPAGTKARGTVVQAQAAGHVKGGAVLALSLDSITAGGQKYSIETREFEDTSQGRGKRTAIGGGGGAAFGAIVGALAGGGKGAAIGALAGGGAGTAGAAFTGKRDISLPAETRLHFKLTKPVSISQQ